MSIIDDIEAEIEQHSSARRTTDPSGSRKSDGERERHLESPPTGWPDPQPLMDELPPVAPFNLRLLPSAFQPWVRDIAERMQCPPDFPGVGAMIALAAVVGRQVGIRPKHRDDWTVVANLWGGVIGRPGILKSPAIQESLRPLKRLEVTAKEVFDEQAEAFEAAKTVAQQAKRVAEDGIRKALRGGKSPQEAAKLLPAEVPAPPTRQRYIANDATVEKLGVLLNENPNGILVFRDELVGLLRSLDKDGQEAARAFYLEAWNGTGRFTYDRIVRGTIDIEAATISILGGIQPGPLTAYMTTGVASPTGDDGLIQRFQLLVWPDVSADWVNIDEWPDSEARNAAFEVFTRLAKLDAAAMGAEHDEHDSDAIPYLRFDEAAQELFDDWRARLESIVRSGDEHPAIESHLAKFRSLIPSLALLIHLADGGHGPVSAEALHRAIAWGRYLESHARRVYAAQLGADHAAAHGLARRILAGDLPDGFTLRDVYQRHWSGLSTRDEAAKAADVLIDSDWLQVTTEQTRGRSKQRHWINPGISKSSLPGGGKRRKSPSGEATVPFAPLPQGDSQNLRDVDTFTAAPERPAPITDDEQPGFDPSEPGPPPTDDEIEEATSCEWFEDDAERTY